MKATVCITLKAGLLDAQGKTTQQALESLGFKGLTQVRVGKYLELELNHGSAASAQRDVERMCQKLLANPVVETYRIEITRDSRLKTQGPLRASSSQPRARVKRV